MSLGDSERFGFDDGGLNLRGEPGRRDGDAFDSTLVTAGMIVLLLLAALFASGCSPLELERVQADVEHSAAQAAACAGISSDTSVHPQARALATVQHGEWLRRYRRDLERLERVQ